LNTEYEKLLKQFKNKEITFQEFEKRAKTVAIEKTHSKN